VTFALTGARVFDGKRLIDGAAVVVDGAAIVSLVNDADLPAAIERRPVNGLIVPGFIDVQVNGGGGVLFNDTPTAEGIATIAAAHRRFGTTGFLPTLISDTPERMRTAVKAVRDALGAGVPGLLGVHFEGPWLNPARRGVHDAGFFRDLSEADVELLIAPGLGRVLVTLAPERIPVATIARLAAAGVILAAGHTEADAATIRAARAAGLTGFTHLFNAMPPLSGRAPGPVGAALADKDAWCGLIVDLHHVDPLSLQAAIAARGFARTMLVSDAMPTVGTELTRFDLLGRSVGRQDDRLTAEDGTLAGCHLDMATAVRNTVSALGLPLEAALHMASRAPAEFLRLGDALGRIAPGYRANLVRLDADLQVVATWIDGIELGAMSGKVGTGFPSDIA
jgi:N-acetylglucosamine-6-phosphate deacetylase